MCGNAYTLQYNYRENDAVKTVLPKNAEAQARTSHLCITSFDPNEKRAAH